MESAEIQDLPLAAFYDRQQFAQYSPQDLANWYAIPCKSGKRELALFPALGRKHINFRNQNQLQFVVQPRFLFRSISYYYVVVGTVIYRYDQFFNQYILTNPDFNQPNIEIHMAYLPTAQVVGMDANPSVYPVFIMLTDTENMFILNESDNTFVTVTDPNTPPDPQYIVAFGNRFAVSGKGTTQFNLTQVNLGTSPVNPATVFTVSGLAVFAQEAGIIRQMTVLHNQLFIFTDFSTGIWANIQSVFNNSTFPWKKNASYDWDYGMADPFSLAVGFGRMCWLAQNEDGLISFMSSSGEYPKNISTEAINVLLQNNANDEISPFISEDVYGFLYEYNNSIFYRASAGPYADTELLDIDPQLFNCIEYCFDTDQWGRRIELNGDRNRAIQHIFFANRHLITVLGEGTVYEMSGNTYYNELRNTNEPDGQALDAYIAYPMRYEMVTKIISQQDYSEFITEYVEIDFVWGVQSFVQTSNPFANTVFIVHESSTPSDILYCVAEDGSTFIIEEGTNTPVIDDTIYNYLFKPNITLYWSDDGGISFHSADNREFSDLGVYQWRIRWYQLGASRNRCYKLVCVSPSPITVLGGVMNVKRASGGAN